MERLFEAEEDRGAAAPGPGAPLAARMRPRNLDELVGQSQILHPGSALRTAIEAGRPHSAILFGPPGTGKTTIARLAASKSEAAFEELSAVSAGKAEVRAVLERARERHGLGRSTVFFLDEIHRFNKAQQDQLLPAVEEGLITLIGATTENPYFEVISALISRCQVYELQPLVEGEILELLRRALTDERGIREPPPVDDEALKLIATRSVGDARGALAALDRAVELTHDGGATKLGVAEAEEALQAPAIPYDRKGDRHYDYISAWIKAARGSDPDAALYYLAVMLEGGEDPRFIARRMVVFASEDIGNADPQALAVATAAGAAVDRVGMPECAFNLAQAATYLALAPKSNASKAAIRAAMGHVREHGPKPPPAHLQSAGYNAAKKLGRGVGYRYPHEDPGGVNDQELMPEGLEGTRFYEPTDRGFEEGLRARLESLRRRRDQES